MAERSRERRAAGAGRQTGVGRPAPSKRAAAGGRPPATGRGPVKPSAGRPAKVQPVSAGWDRLRLAAYFACGFGLVVFYIAALLPNVVGEGSRALAVIWGIGLVITIVGCLLLTGLTAWPRTRPRKRAVREAVFGFACLLTGLISLIGAIGDEQGGVNLYWLIATIFLLPSSFALIVFAAGVQRHGPRKERKERKNEPWKEQWWKDQMRDGGGPGPFGGWRRPK